MMVKRQKRRTAVHAYTTGWSTLTGLDDGLGKSGTSWIEQSYINETKVAVGVN